MATVELPSWLAVEQRYEPAGARHRVMQKNVLHLASLLERVRLGGGAHKGGSIIDRALSSVSAPVRLVGMFVCVLCVCLTQSPLYLMLMTAIALVLVAVRPVRGLRATFVPALAAAGFAVVLALPALLLGASATGAMLKIALKTFVNVSLVLGVSWTLTWSRMSAALKMLHLPDEVIFTFDMALKHIEVLGRTAHDLCESVMLRSVGRAPAGFSRTDSIAGIMGMTFIKAMECSRAMDEAMLCRGFAGAYPAPTRNGFGWRDAVYAAVVMLLAVLCAVL
ncbi:MULTISPECIES: energy-coupling factor transporter transmembrane component T family protein [unclassified Collinsella]|uniref:energy-coupling factor transporter transmembrane component T family protein n=1 Tax=unclassified Collinsella TaxID=2637548 RepID=UPI003F8B929A